MAGPIIRIFSDVHYGDRASQVRDLAQLQPLTAGVDQLIVNGDMLDTRAGPHPAHTRRSQEEVAAFARRANAPITFLTGNHDPDFSSDHVVELADGAVLALHGDILLDDIVPWGRDARLIRRKLLETLGAKSLDEARRLTLEERIRVWRAVAASIPQRHQSEQNLLKYVARFAADTVWPPDRFLNILRTWKHEPARAAALARQHRPRAKFILLGHTHRPSIRRGDDGLIVINTGSFTAPFGGFSVELGRGRLVVRRTEYRQRAFHPGPVVGEFPLANP